MNFEYNCLASVSHLLICALAVSTLEAHADEPILDEINRRELVALDSPVGRRLLSQCKSSTDFFQLVCTYETQENLAYCGVASSVMLLNALDIEKPISPNHGQYRMFTQRTFFSSDASAVKSAEAVSRGGMTLAELGQFLTAHNLSAETHFADASNVHDFRAVLKEVTSDSDSFLLVNYLRSAIGQKTGGHISPVGAYDGEADRVLILDVSRYKYGPVWVSTEQLWAAMGTNDSESGKSRGFVHAYTAASESR